MVFSENTFLTGCNSSSMIAFWGPTGVVHIGQRDTKYPSCPERVPGLAPSGSSYTLVPHRSRWRRYRVLPSQTMVFQGEQSGRCIRKPPLQQAHADSPIFRIAGISVLSRGHEISRQCQLGSTEQSTSLSPPIQREKHSTRRRKTKTKKGVPLNTRGCAVFIGHHRSSFYSFYRTSHPLPLAGIFNGRSYYYSILRDTRTEILLKGDNFSGKDLTSKQKMQSKTAPSGQRGRKPTSERRGRTDTSGRRQQGQVVANREAVPRARTGRLFPVL
jgi:hypothetical protein